MPKLVDLLDQLKYRRTFGFMDDFDWFISPHRWTTVTSTGSVGISSDGTVGGVLQLNSSGGSPALNDEAYVKTTGQLFAFAANQPLLFEALISFAEPDSNKNNIAVGLMDTVAAGAIVNGNAGPKTSYSGMLFFKQGGHNQWSCQTSIGSGQTTTPTTVRAGEGTYQTLTGQWQPISADQAEARFFIDGILVAKQLMDFSGANPMCLFAGVKAGSAIAESLLVDYLAGYQLR